MIQLMSCNLTTKWFFEKTWNEECFDHVKLVYLIDGLWIFCETEKVKCCDALKGE